MNEPPILPAIPLPPTAIPPSPIAIPEPTFSTPEALLPQYRPVLLPSYSPSDLQRDLKLSQEDSEETKAAPSNKPLNKVEVGSIPDIQLPYIQEVLPAPVVDPRRDTPRLTEISLPGTDIKIPIPENELLITAAATAATASIVSVAATMTAQSLAKKIKPIFDQLLKRILNRKKKPHESLSFGRRRWVQRRSRRQPSENPVQT